MDIRLMLHCFAGCGFVHVHFATTPDKVHSGAVRKCEKHLKCDPRWSSVALFVAKRAVAFERLAGGSNSDLVLESIHV